MRYALILLAWAVLVLAAAPAVAQQAAAVQLPTYSYFSVGTTVSVPDRGSVYAGGVKRAASGSSGFGTPLLKSPPFRNQALGMDRSASGTSVSGYVHDFQAMEKALVGGASAAAPLTRRRSGGSAVGLEALRAGVVPRAQLAAPVPSVAAARAERRQEEMTRQEEAADFLRRGRAAEAAGRPNVARIYYEMASRRATGELKQEIVARLAAVKTPTPSSLAQGDPIDPASK